MFSSLKTFDLQDLHPATPFLLSWGYDSSRMLESIRSIGLVTPLVLWPRQDRYYLLCGHRRLNALRALGREQFPALLLPPEIDERQALVMALQENLAHRGFNDAEKVLAVNALKRFFSPEEIIRDHLPGLGLPPRREFFDRYASLDELGEVGLDALARENLDPETGETLTGLSAADQRAVLRLFDRLNPGRNKRREILTWLEEIARRENLTFDRILASEEIGSVLSAENLSRPQQEKKVREILRKRRYPHLSQMEKLRSARIRALKLPPQIRLNPPPHFEGLEFTMEVTFKDMDTFDRAVGAMDKLKDNPDLAALMELG